MSEQMFLLEHNPKKRKKKHTRRTDLPSTHSHLEITNVACGVTMVADRVLNND